MTYKQLRVGTYFKLFGVFFLTIKAILKIDIL